MSNSITLTSSMRSSLYALQTTESLIDDTNYRLSTGKKINSALDDPINYFAAQNHTQRASDLELRKDSMSEAIQLITAADAGIESISDLIDSAKSTAQSALSAETTTEANELMEQFNDLLDQIDDLADDSGYSGVNLLGGTSESLEVFFDENGDSSVVLTGFDASSSGLGISAQSSWYTGTSVDKTTINEALDTLSDAKATLRSESKSLSNQLSTVTAREDFTENMINCLEDGAGNLVNADLNEESANLLVLETQQQLGTNALSIASQSMQSVLNLF